MSNTTSFTKNMLANLIAEGNEFVTGIIKSNYPDIHLKDKDAAMAFIESEGLDIDLSGCKFVTDKHGNRKTTSTICIVKSNK